MEIRNPIKPTRLHPGDTIAVLSPSWGGPSLFPRVFDLGLRILREDFGLQVVESPTTRADADWLYRNPKARAEAINGAFADPEVHAIFASIGGDDSIRILRYLDLPLILSNPKIILGYSDTDTILTYLNQQGLVTFNGPSIMSGFAQARHLPAAFSQHIHDLLFSPAPTYLYRPFPSWADGYPDWNAADYNGETKQQEENAEGWHWLQGNGRTVGSFFGGCLEVMEFLKGTRFWPLPDSGFWKDRILFLETSEDKPGVDQMRYSLRNYGAQGAFDEVSGLLIGRAYGYTQEEKQQLYATAIQVVAEEFGAPHLPIIANMDFGHTDPQYILPLGIPTEIDCDSQIIRLLEPAVL